MPAWIQLPAEKAHAFYRVPSELASSGRNHFYGAAHHPRDADGPWPLLAFLPAPEAGIITFCFNTVEVEQLADKAFTPLHQPGGYLNLDREALAELIELLRSFAATLTSGPAAPLPMFQPIEASKLADFGLRTTWFAAARERYYQQIYDPLELPGTENTRTVLILSAGRRTPGRARLYFKVAHFPRQALRQPSFDVLDDALARINLHRAGMEEFARLLEGQLGNMTAS